MKKISKRKTVAVVKLSSTEEDALRLMAEVEDLPRTTIVRRLIRRAASQLKKSR